MAATADYRKDEQHKKSVARAQGYEDEACSECDNFTLVRDGTSLKCDRCGTTQDEDPTYAGNEHIIIRCNEEADS